MADKTERIKSQKYTGVYYRKTKKDEKVYYVTYKDKRNSTQYYRVGKNTKTQNIITERYCFDIRNKIQNNIIQGKPPLDGLGGRKTKPKTLNEVATQYFETRELQPKTKFAYKLPLKTFGDEDMADITPARIDEYKNTLRAQGYAPKTINGHIDTLRALFNFAINQKLFKDENPTSPISRVKRDINNKKTGARERYLSFDEVATLRRAVKDDFGVSLFVEIALSTGARISTICEITKKDIDLNNKAMQLHNKKGHSHYTGYISGQLEPLLMQRLQSITNPNEKILTLSNRQIERRLSKILNGLFNVGLDLDDTKNRTVIHTLRHTFASSLAIQSTPIFTIMKLLDHKDIKDTLRYAKLSPDNGLNAVRQLWSCQ